MIPAITQRGIAQCTSRIEPVPVALSCSSFDVIAYFLLRLDLDAFALDREAQTIIDAHILICDPDQGELCDNVTPPIAVK